MSVSYVECEHLKVKFLGAVSFFFVMDTVLRTKVSTEVSTREKSSLENFTLKFAPLVISHSFAMYFWIDQVEPTNQFN